MSPPEIILNITMSITQTDKIRYEMSMLVKTLTGGEYHFHANSL